MLFKLPENVVAGKDLQEKGFKIRWDEMRDKDMSYEIRQIKFWKVFLPKKTMCQPKNHRIEINLNRWNKICQFF